MAYLIITDTVDVQRLTRTGNKEGYDATPVYTGLDCQIMPAGTDILAIYGGNYSLSLYEIYFTEAVALKNGDRLVSGDKQYVVRGVTEAVDHRHLTFTKAVGEKVV